MPGNSESLEEGQRGHGEQQDCRHSTRTSGLSAQVRRQGFPEDTDLLADQKQQVEAMLWCLVWFFKL